MTRCGATETLLTARATVAGLATCLAIAACAAPTAYPGAHRGDTTDVFHGERVADPYRWLERLDAPDTLAWLGAETAVTRRWLDGVAGRDRIAREVAAAIDVERTSYPKKRGSHWFFTRTAAGGAGPVLVVAESPGGDAREILDVPGLARYSVSPRGTYVAYGVSSGGSDWVDWHIREVATGRELTDRAAWTKYYGIAWMPDETGFYYSRFPDPAPGQELVAKDVGCTVRYHRLGATEDPVVVERPDHPTWQFEPIVTYDGRWLVITTSDGEQGDRGTEAMAVRDLAAGGDLVPLVDGFDATYLYVANKGATFYLRTTSEAPNGRVIAIDATTGKRTTVIPEEPTALDDVVRSGDRLVVSRFVDARSRVDSVAFDGSDRREIALPGDGSARLLPMPPDEPAIYIWYASFAMPPTTLRFLDGRRQALQTIYSPINASMIDSEQVVYAAKDGTRIPMFVVHKKGLVRDGSNPTYLTSYGATATAMTPDYSPMLATWLAAGGVVAVPVIRGGPEYGEAWAQAAEKTHRQVEFDDFIAAAEYLVAQQITRPDKLAIAGASNGGLLVAVAGMQRPDLFGAVIVKAAVLDMLRFSLAGQGEGWEGVYGSPAVPDEYRALRAYSPVHNAKPARYPAMLVITGEHDNRVAPWHSYKLVAALQAAQRGPAPILLHVATSAGHAGGSTTATRVRDAAIELSFIARALDL